MTAQPQEWKPFQVTDHLDDEATVIGLSRADVDECKFELARRGEVIRELESEISETDGYFLAKVKAGRYMISKDGQEILLDTAFGYKQQPKTFDGGTANPFAYELAGVKASWNACLRLIPKAIQEKTISRAKEKKRVKKVPEEEKKEKDWKKGFQKAAWEMKKKLGEEVYYTILKRNGFKEAREVPDRETAKQIYQEWKEKANAAQNITA